MSKVRLFFRSLRAGTIQFDSLIIAALLLVMVVVVSQARTFSWYDDVRKAEGAEKGVTSDEHLLQVKTFSVYFSDKTTSAGDEIYLKNYDYVFGRNSDTAAYVVIPVQGDAVRRMGHTVSFQFGYTGDYMTDSKVVENLSNVVQFQMMLLDRNLGSYGDLNGLYWDNKDVHTFVKDNAKSGVTIPMDCYSVSGTAYVAVRIDYNRDLIKEFLDSRGEKISVRLDRTQSIEFAPDLSVISVSAD